MQEPSGKIKEECMIVDASIGKDFHGSTICIKEVNVDGIQVRVAILKLRELKKDLLNSLVALKHYYQADVLGLDVSGPQASKTAELVSYFESILSHLGIKLVKARRDERVRVKSLVIRPQLDSRSATKIFVGKIKGQIAGFIGSLAGRRVDFLGLELAYIPLRCYNILYNKRFNGGDELVAQEAEYCFETATGTLVTIEDDELVVDTSLMELGELDDVVVTAYEYISRKGEASIDELAEVLGSTDRAEIVVRMLVDYGLLEPVGLNTYVPRGPAEPSNVRRYFMERKLAVEGRPPKCSRVLGPGIDLTILDRIVSVWGVVREIWDVYFPVYVGVFRRWKGNEGVEIATIIDAIWGHRLEDIEELVASSEVRYEIDEIIQNIINEGENVEEECPDKPVKEVAG